MHYIVMDDCLVKSENAALTTKQTNKEILNYINNLPNNIVSLDYGCGKLRHALHLYPKCSRLVVIDSDIQINRKQMINNNHTSVVEYTKTKLPHAEAFSIYDSEWKKQKYDFVLCSNVLSAIPSQLERKIIIDNIKEILKPQGKALISVQFRNSYFNTYLTNRNASKFFDGWLIKKDSFYTFYGLIMPNDLIYMCEEQGLVITKRTIIDGSIYLEVGLE